MQALKPVATSVFGTRSTPIASGSDEEAVRDHLAVAELPPVSEATAERLPDPVPEAGEVTAAGQDLKTAGPEPVISVDQDAAGAPEPMPKVNRKPTHTDWLHQLVVAIAQDDREGGRSAALGLMADVEGLLEEFAVKPPALVRIEGLATVLKNLTGHSYIADQHFLYMIGQTLLSEEDIRSQLGAVRNLLQLADRVSGQRAARPLDWLKLSDRPELLNCYRSLATAVSYLARSTHSCGLSGLFTEELAAELEARDWFLVVVASFSRVPFTSGENRLHTLFEAAFANTDMGSVSLLDLPVYVSKIDRVNKEIIPRYRSAAANLMTGPAQGGDRIVSLRGDNYEAALAKFESSFLDSDRGLARQGANVIASRSFINSRNFERIRDRLAEYEEASRDITVRDAANVSFMARLRELRIIMSEVGVIGEYRRGIEQLVADGLLSAPDPQKTHDRILLLAFDQDRVLPTHILPFLPMFQRRGYAIYSIADDGFVTEATPLWPHTPVLSPEMRDVLAEHGAAPEAFLNDWTIALQDGVLSCDGVNYFEGMYERVGRVLKIYTVDWSLASVQVYLRSWLTQLDSTIYALKALRDHCRATGTRVTLFSIQSHFVPYYGMKQFAAANPDVFEHVTISSSYESWQTNASGKPLSTLVMQNNTRLPEPSLPAFGLEEDFSRWCHETYEPNRAAYAEKASALVNIARSGTHTPESAALLDDLRARVKGRKVFCALGKIPYDLAVPYQGGPAHSSMQDWLNHTVATIESSDSFLIIKPHPHEMNDAIANRGNEYFCDLITRKLPENVFILPHRGINLGDIIGLVDVFLCWNGSSIAELGSQGAAIMAADDWAVKNYPIGVLLPQDRAEYEAMLRGEKPVVMAEDFRERSIAYVNFLVEAPFAIRFPFATRSSTNVRFNHSAMDWSQFTPEAIEEMYLRNADLIERVMLQPLPEG